MKQTAVEFLANGLFDILQEAENNNILEVGTQNFKRYIEMFEKKAKEIEKQQQGYSEEEVYHILCEHTAFLFAGGKSTLTDWFETVKKK